MVVCIYFPSPLAIVYINNISNRLLGGPKEEPKLTELTPTPSPLFGIPLENLMERQKQSDPTALVPQALSTLAEGILHSFLLLMRCLIPNMKEFLH